MFFYFLLGTKILFLLTIIFYIVFFCLTFYWAETKSTFLIVPLLYTFKFFLIGFAVVVVISLFIESLPIILSYF